MQKDYVDRATRFALVPAALAAILTVYWFSRPVEKRPAVVLSAQQVQIANSPAYAAWKKIAHRLNAADAAAYQAISKQCDRVSAFFHARKQRARAFAEETLSYRSKWRFLKSKLPFTDADGHREFLGEKFREVVFSQGELEELLVSCVKACVAELESIEKEAIFDIRSDLADDALGALKDGAFSSDAALREAYAQAVERASKEFKSDLKFWAGREAVTQYGGTLAAPVLRSLAVSLAGRLGVSSATLGGGLASGTVTLGTGVVAGIIIDLLLERLLRLFGYDPEAEIEQCVQASLDYCGDLIVFGVNRAALAQGLRKPFDPLARNEQPVNGRWDKPSNAAHLDSGQPETEGLMFHLSNLFDTQAALRDRAIWALLEKGGAQ